MTKTISPFARHSQKYAENGLCVLPIAPGTKRPGLYASGKWSGMGRWNEYFTRHPTQNELDTWSNWPDAGLGLVCGKISNVIAVDVDTDDPTLLRMLGDIMPPSPVRKRGLKGFTAFYRYTDGQRSRSWDVKKSRVVDILADGRQTVMPGTPHPDGMSYVYLTADALEDFSIDSLPELPPDFNARMEFILSGMQTPEDRAYRRPVAHETPDAPEEMSERALMFKNINQQALDRLDEWVPRMIPGAKTDVKGYRCKAFWRGAQNRNVGIHPTGIYDFGGNYGMTPIDLVMYAQGVTFGAAVDALCGVLKLYNEPVTMTVGGKGVAADTQEMAPKKEEAAAVKPTPQAQPVTPKPAPVATSGPRQDADPMARALNEKREQEDAQAAQAENTIPEFVVNAPGWIGKIADWINVTSQKTQPEFAVAAALATLATVMGRRFRTDMRNFSSLYFCIIAKSGEGKDHPQECIRKLLRACDLEDLVVSGYTHSSAVYTELIRTPSHICIMDEMGQMLKQSANPGSGLDTVNTVLLQVSSAADGQVSPHARAQLGLNKQERRSSTELRIYNPALTFFGATTPGVFFSALSDSHVEGGFVGRFILVQSNLPRRLRSFAPAVDLPSDIEVFLRGIVEESASRGTLGDVAVHNMQANPVAMEFAPECHALIREFEYRLNQRKDAMEATNSGDVELLARTAEKALRIAMIVAKASNPPLDNTIRPAALQWAIEYVQHYDYATVNAFESKKPLTRIEEQIKQVVKIIKRAKNFTEKAFFAVTQTGAMPHGMLLQKMKLDSREFGVVMQTAIDSGVVHKQLGLPEVGYAGTVYMLRTDPD